MNRERVLPVSLRVFAICIAVAAAIDPAITSNRTTRPEISVVAADPQRDAAFAARVAGALGSGFAVTPEPLGAADATVIVGDRLPADREDLATPVFAVSRDRDAPAVAIEGLDAPSWTPVDARVPVVAATRVTGARGETVEATLRMGDIVVDRATRTVNTNDERIEIPLTFTPTTAGAVALRLTATIGGGAADQTSAADLAVDVRDQRWSVLFFDPRPSWLSTFARRAIEADNRFVVTSRVVTSRNISTDAGTPPSSLDDAAGVERFDAVVVGAPDALNDRDVSGLDGYLRRRGGSVVLLLDQRADGPYQRLTGAGAWRNNVSGREEVIVAVGGDSSTLRASDLAWPARFPDEATPLAFDAPVKGDTTPRVPIVWRIPVGAGRLVVSGALDAWRFRDPAVSGFDAFWRNVISAAANAAPPPVAVTLSNAVVAPGESIDITAQLRDAALQALPARASISAVLQSTNGQVDTPVRLWPDGPVGQFRGTVRAPGIPGAYRLAVAANGNHADAVLIVATGATHPAPRQADLLAAWAGAHGGGAMPAAQIGQLPAALRRAIHATPRPTRWHPMRSFWWLVPFALALSGEWWWRRRRGLA